MFRLLLRCALQGLAVALFFDLASLCTVLVLYVCVVIAAIVASLFFMSVGLFRDPISCALQSAIPSGHVT